jgi:hypothetical protein
MANNSKEGQGSKGAVVPVMMNSYRISKLILRISQEQNVLHKTDEIMEKICFVMTYT